MPALLISSESCVSGTSSQCGTRRGRCNCVECGSTAMRIDGCIGPAGCGQCSIDLTVPAAVACTREEMKPADSAITSPRSTRSPGLTSASAGRPRCCDSGRMISSGNGRRRDAMPDVSSLFSGG